MRPRAAPSLASLRRPELLASLGEGMGLIAEHVATLERIAEQQEGPSASRAVEVTRVVSDEEAGKFLILLDVARAGFANQAVKREQLGRTASHIAKGIYARAVDIRPADFAEVLRYADGLRRSHYLDGPNDVDWIFRNEIEAEREETLYVDYVATDDGNVWVTPQRLDDIHPRYPSGAVELVGAMARAGFCEPGVLSTVSEVWRDFHPAPETQWSENRELNVATVERIPVKATDERLSDDDVSRIVNRWSFPLYEADLSKIKVDLEDLRQQQRNWDPDGFTLDDYY
jgi:hypothetical protein